MKKNYNKTIIIKGIRVKKGYIFHLFANEQNLHPLKLANATAGSDSNRPQLLKRFSFFLSRHSFIFLSPPSARRRQSSSPQLSSRPIPGGPCSRRGRRHDQSTVRDNQPDQLPHLCPGGKIEGARRR